MNKKYANLITIGIIIMTLIDVVFTYIGLKYGWLSESNVLLEGMFRNMNIIPFIMVFLITTICILFINKVQYKYRIAQYGLSGLLFVKLAIVSLHAEWVVYLIA